MKKIFYVFAFALFSCGPVGDISDTGVDSTDPNSCLKDCMKHGKAGITCLCQCDTLCRMPASKTADSQESDLESETEE